MNSVGLITAIMALLAPYIEKGAVKLAEELGKKVPSTAAGLIKGLFGRWKDKPEETETLKKFVTDPEGSRDQFVAVLSAQLHSDPELASALEDLLRTKDPRVFVDQLVTSGEDILGADIEEMLSGTVEVKQDLNDVKGATGVQIGKLGT